MIDHSWRLVHLSRWDECWHLLTLFLFYHRIVVFVLCIIIAQFILGYLIELYIEGMRNKLRIKTWSSTCTDSHFLTFTIVQMFNVNEIGKHLWPIY